MPTVLCLCLLFFLPSGLSGEHFSYSSLTGPLGGSITLPCNYSDAEDLSTVLTCGIQTAYGTGQSKYYERRVLKTGTCDLTLHDLKTTDAGRCHLKARIGEEVMFDDLPRDAESVKHLSNTSSIDVWRREQGVLTDRLMDKDGHLIIKNFRSRDAGTYRVLNSTGGVLVTVMLTEWSTASKDKQDSTRDDNTKVTARDHVCTWIVIGLVGALIALIVITHQYLKRTKERDSSLESETVQEPRSPNDHLTLAMSSPSVPTDLQSCISCSIHTGSVSTASPQQHMLTHTQNSCSAFNPCKVHTHTVNTHTL